MDPYASSFTRQYTHRSEIKSDAEGVGCLALKIRRCEFRHVNFSTPPFVPTSPAASIASYDRLLHIASVKTCWWLFKVVLMLFKKWDLFFVRSKELHFTEVGMYSDTGNWTPAPTVRYFLENFWKRDVLATRPYRMWDGESKNQSWSSSPSPPSVISGPRAKSARNDVDFLWMQYLLNGNIVRMADRPNVN